MADNKYFYNDGMEYVRFIARELDGLDNVCSTFRRLWLHGDEDCNGDICCGEMYLGDNGCFR